MLLFGAAVIEKYKILNFFCVFLICSVLYVYYREVYVTRFVSAGTVEEAMLSLAEKKLELEKEITGEGMANGSTFFLLLSLSWFLRLKGSIYNVSSPAFMKINFLRCRGWPNCGAASKESLSFLILILVCSKGTTVFSSIEL